MPSAKLRKDVEGWHFADEAEEEIPKKLSGILNEEMQDALCEFRDRAYERGCIDGALIAFEEIEKGLAHVKGSKVECEFGLSAPVRVRLWTKEMEEEYGALS